MNGLDSNRWFCRRVVLCVSILAGILLTSETALASGFYLPGRGVEPMGRAGAFVASGTRDLNSLWYNPANVAGFDDTVLTADVAVADLGLRFKRAPRTRQNGDTERYREVSNNAPPQAIPQILIGGPSGVEGLTWGAGLYGPYLNGVQMPPDGPQRYTQITNQGSGFGFLHVAASYRINERLRIGAGLQNAMGHFRLVQMTSGYTGLFGSPEDRDLDILTEFSMTSLFNPTGNLGAWAKPVDWLELGMSYQLPVTFNDSDADLRVRMPSHPAFDNASVEKDRIQSSVDFPGVFRFGIRHASKSYDVELSFVYEGWSTFDRVEAKPEGLKVTGVPGMGAIPAGGISIPMNFDDTFSLRLGGGYQLNTEWRVRAGYTFEQGAIPRKRYSVFLPDTDKHMFSAGTTWGYSERISFDASGAWYAFKNRTITNSTVEQINPVDTENELATVVGNGNYRANYVAVGAGLNYSF